MDMQLTYKLPVILTGEGRQGTLAKHLHALGIVPTCCNTEIDLRSLLSQDSSKNTVIIITEDILTHSEEQILELIRSTDSDSANIFLIETIKSHTDVGDQWWSIPNCDILPVSTSKELLRKKLLRAQSLAESKSTSTQVHSVLQKYAEHIDTIAEERTRQLIQAERLSTIGIMTAGISHEFNTPISYITTSLATVKLIAASLTEQLTDNPEGLKQLQKIPKALERMEHGLERLTRISSSLKNFGAHRSEERSVIPILSVIDEALELASIENSRRILIERVAPAELPNVFINPQEIEQVLVNLLVNSSHALENTSDAIVRITVCEQNGETIEISIEDNGPGIPEEKRESIWLPFFTTKARGKGTGLGLYICSGIIKKHSGNISYFPSQLGGAGFRIKLPLSQE